MQEGANTADKEAGARQPGRFGLRALSGTTIALAALGVLGVAAVVTAPVWLWNRGKRKRVDALLRQTTEAPGEANETQESSEPSDGRPGQ